MVAKHASSNPSKRFICNMSAAFVVQVFKDLMMQVMPYIDILVGNDDEAKVFASSLGFDEHTRSDIKKTVAKLAALPRARTDGSSRIVVITQGARPVIVAHGDQVDEYPISSQIFVGEIVDTNGAGDAFVGGFLAQLIRGRPVKDCISCGIYAAQIVIRRLGCTFPDEHPNLDHLPSCCK